MSRVQEAHARGFGGQGQGGQQGPHHMQAGKPLTHFNSGGPQSNERIMQFTWGAAWKRGCKRAEWTGGSTGTQDRDDSNSALEIGRHGRIHYLLK